MLQLDHFGGDGFLEGAVVLDEEHGGLVFLNQLFDLQAAGEVDVIQGFERWACSLRLLARRTFFFWPSEKVAMSRSK